MCQYKTPSLTAKTSYVLVIHHAQIGRPARPRDPHILGHGLPHPMSRRNCLCRPVSFAKSKPIHKANHFRQRPGKEFQQADEDKPQGFDNVAGRRTQKEFGEDERRPWAVEVDAKGDHVGGVERRAIHVAIDTNI